MGADQRIVDFSEEQVAFRDAVVSGQSCKGAAYAGTGKTSITVESAAAHKARGQYVTFNRAPADEARPKFKARAPHVRVSNWHRLAFRAIGKHYQHRLQQRNVELRIALAERFANALPKKQKVRQAFLGAIADTIRQFELSADRDLTVAHVPDLVRQTVLGEFADYISTIARSAWTDIADPFGTLPVSHDAYFKVWALSSPRLKTDVLYCDEWQDTNPVTAGVVAAQHNAQLVLVGDEYQAIYGWRGAVNALSLFDLPEYPLTTSWRFGKAIADVATLVLRALKAPYPLIGGGGPSYVRCDFVAIPPSGIIARSNAGVVEATLYSLERERVVCILGGAERVTSALNGLYELWTTGSSSHPDFRFFASFEELLEIAQSTQGAQYRPYIRLLERYGHQIPQIARRLRDETVPRDQANLLIGTPHQWKGDETGVVLVWGDYGPFACDTLNPATQMYEPTIFVEEAHVAYVTLTRARSLLLIGNYAETLAESLVTAARLNGDTSVARDGARLVPSQVYDVPQVRPSALSARSALLHKLQMRS